MLGSFVPKTDSGRRGAAKTLLVSEDLRPSPTRSLPRNVDGKDGAGFGAKSVCHKGPTTTWPPLLGLNAPVSRVSRAVFSSRRSVLDVRPASSALRDAYQFRPRNLRHQRESTTGAAGGGGRGTDDDCAADGCALGCGGLGCGIEPPAGTGTEAWMTSSV